MTVKLSDQRPGPSARCIVIYKQTFIRQNNPAFSDLYEDIVETIPDKPE